jgi:hypothetical protein
MSDLFYIIFRYNIKKKNPSVGNLAAEYLAGKTVRKSLARRARQCRVVVQLVFLATG